MGEAKIALIHDELIRRGGAEVVFEEMIRLFPKAEVFSLYAGTPKVTIDERSYPIHTSWLQKMPLWTRRHPGRLLPFLPQAAEQFDFSKYDLVISSASGFAKSIITRSNVPHICYCHTPTRYLWDSAHNANQRTPRAGRLPLQIILHYLRVVDFAAAQRVDSFIANSQYTADRISTYYRRNSEIIYPPIDTAYFTPSLPKQGNGYFLVVGRLTPGKHFDQAVNVCEKLALPLVVVGAGRELSRLKRLAGPHTVFTGKVSREKLRQYYRHARAILQPGTEDFGMATAEAMACGTPVIAHGQGGIKEIVEPYKHGYLYREPLQEALAEGIRRFITFEKNILVQDLQTQAMRFSTSIWQNKMKSQVELTLKKGDTVSRSF